MKGIELLANPCVFVAECFARPHSSGVIGHADVDPQTVDDVGKRKSPVCVLVHHAEIEPGCSNA